jgi:hypothetical protein
MQQVCCCPATCVRGVCGISPDRITAQGRLWAEDCPPNIIAAAAAYVVSLDKRPPPEDTIKRWQEGGRRGKRRMGRGEKEFSKETLEVFIHSSFSEEWERARISRPAIWGKKIKGRACIRPLWTTLGANPSPSNEGN